MFQKKIVETIKTQFMFNNFFSENCGIFERMRKNMVELDKPQMTI